MLLSLPFRHLLMCYNAISYVGLICVSPTVKIDYFLSCAAHCTYLYMRTQFLLYTRPYQLGINTPLFYKGGNLGTERLSHLPQVTQQAAKLR